MNKHILWLEVILGLIVISSCEKGIQPIKVTSISLNPTSISLVEGETGDLVATIFPADADNQKIAWSSSNNSVASVNNGKVTAHKSGLSTITATTEDGGYTATCEVAVLAAKTDPICVTGGYKELTEYSVILSGMANLPSDLSGTVVLGVVCSLEEIPSQENGVSITTNELDSNSSFFVSFGNLTHNTTYYYRAFVKRNDIYTYGETKSFTTKKIEASVITGDFTDVSESGITLNGSFKINNNIDFEEIVFVYSDTYSTLDDLLKYGKRTQSSPSVEDNGQFSIRVNWGVIPDHFYYTALVCFPGGQFAGEVVSADLEDYPFGSYNKVLILYLAGYNSLRDYLYEDIQNLKLGYAPLKKSDRALLIVSHLSVKRGDYSTPTSPQLIRVYNNKTGVVLETLKSYDGNLSEPSTMSAILTDIKNQFPSEHYGMVFSSHATGWMPTGYYNHPEDYEPSPSSSARREAARPDLPPGTYYHVDRELLPGEPLTKSLTMTNSPNTATEMELKDFKASIPMHLDYLLMDACLMGCVEVAYEFKDICNQIGFSPTEILVDGFNYKNLAGHLLSEDEPNTRAVVDDYFKQYASKPDRTERSATISLVDCTKLDALASACKILFAKYSDKIDTLEPNSVQRYFRNDKHWFYDLEDILVKADINSSERASLTSALNDCILYKAATEEFLKNYGGFTIRTFSGFSMYLPCDGSAYLDSYYKELMWNKQTRLIK